jgi:uncharacterized protein
MVYLDLEEIDQVFQGRWFWSSDSPNLAWFRREDYLGGDSGSIADKVREVVLAAGGPEPKGPIRLLTHLRYFGYCFNPVSFYYCFMPDGKKIQTIVAEITNTPWNERKTYVLIPENDVPLANMHRYCFPKTFHVSPFMPMNLLYDWRFSEPDEKLNIHMRLEQEGKKVFDASLNMKRYPMSGYQLARALLMFIPMSIKVIAGIYIEAMKLKLKGIPVYDHPDTLKPEDGDLLQ